MKTPFMNSPGLQVVYFSLQLNMIGLCHLWSYKITNERGKTHLCLPVVSSPSLALFRDVNTVTSFQYLLSRCWVGVQTLTDRSVQKTPIFFFRRLHGLPVASFTLARAPCIIIVYVSTISWKGHFHHASYSCEIPTEPPALKTFALCKNAGMPLLLTHKSLSINTAIMDPPQNRFQYIVFHRIVSGLGKSLPNRRKPASETRSFRLSEKAWPLKTKVSCLHILLQKKCSKVPNRQLISAEGTHFPLR